MLAKNLMILGIACTVPPQASADGNEPGTPALATAFGDAAVEAADPGFDVGGLVLDHFDTAALMDGSAVANIGRASKLLNPLSA